tara:strand:- start:3193 stop:3969 length:777 start_codon:yes stop_codon:yes gene_type:complete
VSRIKGKLALITGASAGIGEACAKQLARDGANLILWARRKKRLADLASEITDESGVTVDIASIDIRDHELVFKEANQLRVNGLSPDIVINNAGMGAGMSLMQEGKVEDWNRMIDTNVKGLLFVTRAFLPDMVERDHGHLVNIGSIAGRQVYPRGNVYNATKYAVQALTEGTNLDVLGTKVRVSSVNPGLVETEFSLVRFDGDEARAEAVYEGLDALRGQDVAEVVSFVVNAPPHMNVADVLVFSTDQRSIHHVHRNGS